jgi:ribonuclease P protein component
MGEAYVSAEQPQTGEEPRLPPSHVDPSRAGHPEGPAAQGPAPALRLIWRIRDRATFTALRRGRRVRRGPITVSWIDGDPAEPPRVAYAIGRSVGHAVARNRLRRRLRASMTSLAPQLPPGAYLIGATPEASQLSFPDLQTNLHQAITQVTEAAAPAARRSGAARTT